jgi:hypothetical protein
MLHTGKGRGRNNLRMPLCHHYSDAADRMEGGNRDTSCITGSRCGADAANHNRSMQHMDVPLIAVVDCKFYKPTKRTSWRHSTACQQPACNITHVRPTIKPRAPISLTWQHLLGAAEPTGLALACTHDFLHSLNKCVSSHPEHIATTERPKSGQE